MTSARNPHDPLAHVPAWARIRIWLYRWTRFRASSHARLPEWDSPRWFNLGIGWPATEHCDTRRDREFMTLGSLEERARVVEFLRGPLVGEEAERIADAIERGAHLGGEK